MSVAVAAWNEARDLPRLIDSFSKLEYEDKELIICAGGLDGTLLVAQAFEAANIHVIKQEPGDGQRGGQRKCLRIATGAVIFLTDADCILDDTSFRRAVAALSDSEDVAIGGYAPLQEQCDDPLVFYRWCVDSFQRVTKPDFVGPADSNGANFAARREVFAASGDLGAEAATGTDYDMTTRMLAAGYRVRYIRHSVVYTRYETTAAKYVWQNARWLRSAIMQSFTFRRPTDLRHSLIGSVAGLGVILLPLTWPLLGRSSALAWCLIVLGYWGKRLRYLLLHCRLHGTGPRPVFFLQAALFSFLDFAAWALALLQALIPRLRRSW